MSNENQTPEQLPMPGWYPNTQGQQQWWDGTQWGQLANPEQVTETKAKKPWFKKWWVWTIAAVLLIFGVANLGNETAEPEKAPAAEAPVKQPEVAEETPDPAPEPEPEPEPDPEPEIPAEYKSALNKAHTYSSLMHMSKAGIYDQLTSEYGEKFSAEAGQYAIDNMTADWNANALEKARTYQDAMSMSPAAIYDQLISEYGERFTPEEAQYAVDNL